MRPLGGGGGGSNLTVPAPWRACTNIKYLVVRSNARYTNSDRTGAKPRQIECLRPTALDLRRDGASV